MKIDWLLVHELLFMEDWFNRVDHIILAHVEMMQERGWLDKDTSVNDAGRAILETLSPRKKLKTVLGLLEKKGTPATKEIVCALMGRDEK